MTGSTEGFEPDDQHLLQEADPARSLPPADPDRVAALLEETMSHPTAAPHRPTRSRWLLAAGGAAAAAVVATVVVLGVSGDDDNDAPVAVGTPTSTGSSTEATVTALTAAPPVSAKCAVPVAPTDDGQSIAFEGEVTAITDGVVTLTPSRFYVGEATTLVTVAAPDQGMSEAPPEFVLGQRYLVTATDGQISPCSATGSADDELLRGLYVDAFGS